MEAKQLRIGNYVYRQSSKLIVDKSSVYQIENVNLQSALKYDPIPLTKQWILDLGFIKNEIKQVIEVLDISENDKHLEFEITDEGLDLWISSDIMDEALYFPLNHIKYVHQLQNLYFALTGEELTVNN